jgi:hypothetical protein
MIWCLLGLQAVLPLTADRANAPRGGEAADFGRTVGELRAIWLRTVPPASGLSDSTSADMRVRLQKLATGQGPGRQFVGFISGRVASVGGSVQIARSEYLAVLGNALAVERAFALMELVQDSPDARNLHEDCLASLLPISFWRSLVDHRRSQVYIPLPQPPRPWAPVCDRKQLATIAGLLDECEMDEGAFSALAEVVYGGFGPPWSTRPIRNTWYSPAAAEYWLRAAESAHKVGREELGEAFLMKAAVFGSEDLFRRCVDARRRWSTPVASRPSATLSDEDRERKRDALLKVVQLYVDLNVHPRAWTLIDENREVFDKPDERRQEVQAKWLGVVSRTSGGANEIYLYGYEVYPKGDPLNVKIRWALSDEAVAEVRKRLEGMKGT